MGCHAGLGTDFHAVLFGPFAKLAILTLRGGARA